MLVCKKGIKKRGLLAERKMLTFHLNQLYTIAKSPTLVIRSKSLSC